MSYRGGKRNPRASAQQSRLFDEHAELVTWKTLASATTGVSVAGFGRTLYYVERPISALIYQDKAQKQAQTEAGMVPYSEMRMTTREVLGTEDLLIWRGETYRVESEAVPQRIAGTFGYILKRGER